MVSEDIDHGVRGAGRRDLDSGWVKNCAGLAKFANRRVDKPWPSLNKLEVPAKCVDAPDAL
jgi:hypothetical protein